MARVTVEDCVLKVPNRFELVLLAAQRAREISAGAPLTLERDNDKNPVVALREIAEDDVRSTRSGLAGPRPAEACRERRARGRPELDRRVRRRRPDRIGDRRMTPDEELIEGEPTRTARGARTRRTSGRGPNAEDETAEAGRRRARRGGALSASRSECRRRPLPPRPARRRRPPARRGAAPARAQGSRCHDAAVRAGRAGQVLRSGRGRGRAQPRLCLLDEGARRAEARLRRSLFLPPARGRRAS